MRDRCSRVGQAIQETLADLLARGLIRDYRISQAGLVSFTEVRVSADLRHARVYVSVFGEQALQKQVLAGLGSATGFLRREVGRALKLRVAPELDFVLDDSIERGARIDGILKEVKS